MGSHLYATSIHMVEVVVCLVKIIVNNSCNNKNINVYAYICLGYLCIVAKKLVIVVVLMLTRSHTVLFGSIQLIGAALPSFSVGCRHSV